MNQYTYIYQGTPAFNWDTYYDQKNQDQTRKTMLKDFFFFFFQSFPPRSSIFSVFSVIIMLIFFMCKYTEFWFQLRAMDLIIK